MLLVYVCPKEDYTMSKQQTMLNSASERDLYEDANILSMYLKEINRIPMLSREEEYRLAKLATQGTNTQETGWWKRISDSSSISRKISEPGLAVDRLDQRRKYRSDECA